MNLTDHKEITPVRYNSSGVKIQDYTLPQHSLCFPIHWHERLELALIQSGQMHVLLGEDTVTLNTGDLLIVNAGQLHSGFAGEQGVCYTTIMFEPTILQNNSQASANLISPIIRHTVSFYNQTNHPEIIRAVHQLIEYAALQNLSAPLLVQGKTYELLGLMYHFCMQPLSTEPIEDDRFRAVLAYVNEHYCSQLTTCVLSEKFGYEESYFCRRFKSITGMTFTHYVLLLRLEKAQKLLCSRQIRTRDLAASCGFSDVGYFCRCFKKHFGVSSMEYQKQHKNTPIP